MSYWAATVITSLAGVIPFIGNDVLIFLWGGYFIDQQTLTKFYALHYLLPFIILGLVVLHIILLHENGSSNPLGINSLKDSIPFSPYYVYKDIFGIVIFLFFFSLLLFFLPNIAMHPDNYIKANYEITPEHIVPEWYFLPFYGLLRSIPNKTLGVLCMLAGLGFVAIIPFYYASFIQSARFKPLYKIIFWFFIANCMLLGWSGGKPVVDPFFLICILSTFFYFFFLIIFFPLANLFDNFYFFQGFSEKNKLNEKKIADYSQKFCTASFFVTIPKTKAVGAYSYIRRRFSKGWGI